MKIKTTTAFRAFQAARASRAADAKSFMVKPVNKNGEISRMAPTAADWQLNAFATADEAEARRAQLEQLNPGRRYAVVPL